jgi:hypothetical protein
VIFLFCYFEIIVRILSANRGGCILQREIFQKIATL